MLKSLASGARKCLETAFCPKTQQYYKMLFRIFVAFCICVKIDMSSVSEFYLLSFLEYHVTNNISVNMLPNDVSAAKANFTRLGLNFSLWGHPNMKYFLRSIKINHPLKVVKQHVMDLETLQILVRFCDVLPFGIV